MKFACASLVLAAGLLPVSAAQSDSRFDGTWVGMEIVTPTSAVTPDVQKSLPPPYQTRIVIADTGKQVGKFDGVCRGRFQNIRRAGDTLHFSAGDCKLSASLSNDGKTLTEKGTCKMPTTWAIRMGSGSQWPISWLSLQFTATLHRSK